MNEIKEIKIGEIKGIKIGQVENVTAATGCTVIICETGARTGLDVRGGGPASRETELLKPAAATEAIHAIVFSGGSAFGLAAADGVMEYLEEHGIGYDVGITKVPLVCQSSLFDLTVAEHRVRPDKAMGYAACEAAQTGNYRDGNYGAGVGATVGKFYAMERCMKSGIGSYALRIGELEIGAIVAVNAFGDVYDYENGEKVAGLLNETGDGFCSTVEEMARNHKVVENKFTGNTTIGAVITNGDFDKRKLGKIAAMGQNGMARTIRPVHTSADGDSLYAMSVGDIPADMDTVGALAAQVVAKAILRAVESAESAYGYPAASELRTS